MELRPCREGLPTGAERLTDKPLEPVPLRGGAVTARRGDAQTLSRSGAEIDANETPHSPRSLPSHLAKF